MKLIFHIRAYALTLGHYSLFKKIVIMQKDWQVFIQSSGNRKPTHVMELSVVGECQKQMKIECVLLSHTHQHYAFVHSLPCDQRLNANTQSTAASGKQTY